MKKEFNEFKEREIELTEEFKRLKETEKYVQKTEFKNTQKLIYIRRKILLWSKKEIRKSKKKLLLRKCKRLYDQIITNSERKRKKKKKKI